MVIRGVMKFFNWIKSFDLIKILKLLNADYQKMISIISFLFTIFACIIIFISFNKKKTKKRKYSKLFNELKSLYHNDSALLFMKMKEFLGFNIPNYEISALFEAVPKDDYSYSFFYHRKQAFDYVVFDENKKIYKKKWKWFVDFISFILLVLGISFFVLWIFNTDLVTSLLDKNVYIQFTVCMSTISVTFIWWGVVIQTQIIHAKQLIIASGGTCKKIKNKKKGKTNGK